MYTYKDSVALSRSVGSQWEHYNLEDIVLHEVYSKFITAYIQVFEDVVDVDLIVDMEKYRVQLATSTLTVKEWLKTMEGLSLHTVDAFPDASLASVAYANAVQYGYKIELAKAGFPYPETMPQSDLHDLVVTRPNFSTNLELLKSHCLLSVNGFFHRSDYAQGKAYILDGGRTALKNRCSHTGITSFLDIAPLTQVRIKPDHIRPLTEDHPLSEGVILSVPEDMTGKSLILILGGYIVRPEDNVLWPMNDNEWCFNIKGIPFVERIMESEYSLDLSSMEIEHLDTNPENAYRLEDLYSDKSLMAYLTLSQSFFVIVDTPELFYNKIFVRNSNLPGLITAYQDPKLPVIIGYGKAIEYSKTEEAGFWALRVTDPWYVQYAWQTIPTRNIPVVTNHWKTWTPYLRSQAYLLEIIGKKKS